jgi:glycosyltransferase involved in cell wall biosynthesis
MDTSRIELMSPKVSYIIPVYNGSAFLRDAVDSILNQSYQNFEIIVINDGSTDNSLDILNTFIDNRIIIINQTNVGFAKSLNIGIKYSRGELIARLDQDDICLVHRTAIQVEYFEANPSCSVLSGSVIYINEDGKEMARSFPITSNYGIRKYLRHFGCIISHPAVMMRKVDLIEVGCYSELIGSRFTDYHLWIKFVRYGFKVSNIPNPLIKYRIWNDSMTSNFILTDKAFLKLKEILHSDYPLQVEVDKLHDLCKNTKLTHSKRISQLDRTSNLIFDKLLIIGELNAIYLICTLKNFYSFFKFK